MKISQHSNPSKMVKDATNQTFENYTVAITIEDLERLDELLLGIGILHLTSHEGQKLGEINGS